MVLPATYRLGDMPRDTASVANARLRAILTGSTWPGSCTRLVRDRLARHKYTHVSQVLGRGVWTGVIDLP